MLFPPCYCCQSLTWAFIISHLTSPHSFLLSFLCVSPLTSYMYYLSTPLSIPLLPDWSVSETLIWWSHFLVKLFVFSARLDFSCLPQHMKPFIIYPNSNFLFKGHEAAWNFAHCSSTSFLMSGFPFIFQFPLSAIPLLKWPSQIVSLSLILRLLTFYLISFVY